MPNYASLIAATRQRFDSAMSIAHASPPTQAPTSSALTMHHQRFFVVGREIDKRWTSCKKHPTHFKNALLYGGTHVPCTCPPPHMIRAERRPVLHHFRPCPHPPTASFAIVRVTFGRSCRCVAPSPISITSHSVRFFVDLVSDISCPNQYFLLMTEPSLILITMPA